METLQEMSTGHIIIEAIILFVVIIAAFYIVYSIFLVLHWKSKDSDTEDKPDDS